MKSTKEQNVDLILVDELDSDDEWITEKEDPLLPIRVMSFKDHETQASPDNMVSS